MAGKFDGDLVEVVLKNKKASAQCVTVILTTTVMGIPSLVSAQSADQSSEPFITVTSPRLERNLYETPAAVSVTSAPDIREGQQRLQLDESLDTVPGKSQIDAVDLDSAQRIEVIRGLPRFNMAMPPAA
jgi:outer membrane receptor for ferrienterochelin and colicin